MYFHKGPLFLALLAFLIKNNMTCIATSSRRIKGMSSRPEPSLQLQLNPAKPSLDEPNFSKLKDGEAKNKK